MGFFFGEAWVLGGLVLCVESDDFPLAIEIPFFLSARAEPIGRTDGDGEGGGKAVLLALDPLSETILPILSVFGVDTLLAGTVLTEIFLPHPAELGSADAADQHSTLFSDGALTTGVLCCWLGPMRFDSQRWRCSLSLLLPSLIFCRPCQSIISACDLLQV
jgi:hypothetical protein